MNSGFIRLARIGAVDFRVHFTCMLWLFAGRKPIALALFIALILIHELGHAFLVRRHGGSTIAIDVHAFGGFCRYGGIQDERRRAYVAGGGLIAQALLLAIAYPLSLVIPQDDPTTRQVFGTVVGVNVVTIALNALPIPWLDGWRCWRPILWWLQERLATTRAVSRHRIPATRRVDDAAEHAKTIVDEIAKMRVSSKDSPPSEV